MSTLKKEREAIVNRLHKARLDRFGEHTTIGEDRYLKDFINEVVVPALISHEEKVMERVRKEVEDYFDIRLEDLVNEHLLNEDPHTETRIFEAKKNRDEILTITNEDNLK